MLILGDMWPGYVMWPELPYESESIQNSDLTFLLDLHKSSIVHHLCLVRHHRRPYLPQPAEEFPWLPFGHWC